MQTGPLLRQEHYLDLGTLLKQIQKCYLEGMILRLNNITETDLKMLARQEHDIDLGTLLKQTQKRQVLKQTQKCYLDRNDTQNWECCLVSITYDRFSVAQERFRQKHYLGRCITQTNLGILLRQECYLRSITQTNLGELLRQNRYLDRSVIQTETLLRQKHYLETLLRQKCLMNVLVH